MIKILCVGKIKENYLNDLIKDYSSRINKYHKLEIIEVKDNNDITIETSNLIKHINKNDYLIGLTIDGKLYSSIDFATFLDKQFISNSSITFIIGGSNGLSKEITDLCNTFISFSFMTFPHGLFRGILLEQIYRAFKINNNESYHK